MTDKKTEDELNVWAFPEVSSDSTAEDDDDFTEEFPSDVNQFHTSPVAVAEVDKTQETHETDAHAELEALKAFYENKIISLSKIIVNLNDTKKMIDNEIFQYLLELVKKISKKVINQEIAVNPQLLKNMIDEMKEKLPSRGGIISVQLSQVDFDRLELEQIEKHTYFKVQHDLQEGDIIVKCNTSEIHAQLNERIDNLLRNANE